MAILHRSTSSVAATANADTSVTLARPSPVPVSGDLLLVAFAKPSGTVDSVITPPSGWTLVPNSAAIDTDAANTLRLALYQKRANGSEPASEAWTYTQSGGPIVTQHVYYSDAGATVSIDQASIAAGTTSSTTRITPSLTVAAARTLVQYHFDIANSTWTVATGTIRRQQIRSTSTSLMLADSAVTAGSYTRTATSTAATGLRVDGIAALLEESVPVVSYTKVLRVDASTSVGTTTLVQATGLTAGVTITETGAGTKIYDIVTPNTTARTFTLTATSGASVNTNTISTGAATVTAGGPLVRSGGIYS